MRSKVSFVVEKAMVPTIATLVIEYVTQFHSEDLEPEPRTRSNKTTPQHRTNSNFNENAAERKSGKALLDYMAKDPKKEWHYSALMKPLTDLGMSENSISPLLSGLAKSGHVVRVRLGVYRLP